MCTYEVQLHKKLIETLPTGQEHRIRSLLGLLVPFANSDPLLLGKAIFYGMNQIPSCNINPSDFLNVS